MLHQQPYGVEPNYENGSNPPPPEFPNGTSHPEDGGTVSLDIQQELSRLEEMILANPRIPLWGRTLVDEEKLLDQLDIIQMALPGAFAEAMAIIQQKEEILLEAEEYGQQIVDAAQAKRAQILDASDIIRQAEREASELRRQVQQECEAMMQETLAQIDRQRRTCQQEIEEIHRQAMAEAQAIQDGADQYADDALKKIEEQLQEMMRIIRNGRQQLQPENPTPHNSQPLNHKKR